ncbi:type II secretion system protein [Planctobacterium marinum]|uniref:type II secretion system protein n=1 Tax=Planctobacterium marinum TaxID=1631968 RepID=UPI001E4CC466|nr:type II secretion system protein [Planctobacterium marinum]MCC2608027.1 type II secretion system GspH family protein [Planctobacterium marinum]
MKSDNHQCSKTTQGFTLVELILVVLILAILSVYVAPRLLNTSDIAATVYQNRAISILRNMQTRAMQDTRNDGYCYKVYFDNANDQFGIPSNDYSVTAITAQIEATCADTIDTSDIAEYFYVPASALQKDGIDLVLRGNDGNEISAIEFDTLGRANQNELTCVGNSVNGYNGCRIEFIGKSSAYVCVESEGYIYAC